MRKPAISRGEGVKAGDKSDICSKVESPLGVTTAPRGKIGLLVSLLRQTEGATIDAMMSATGWQAHSVRGAVSGSVKKSLGLNVRSEKTEAGRVYRIVSGTAA
jgi:hypothetical protein